MLASPRYRSVSVLTRGPMPSTTRGLQSVALADFLERSPASSARASPLPAPHDLDVFLCLADADDPSNRPLNGRDAIYAPLTDPAGVRAVAAAAARDGAGRLMLVAPLAAWQQVSAASRMLPEGLELELARLPIDIVIILRPTTEQAAGRGPAGESRLTRFARFYLSQLRFMLPSAGQPLRAVEIARAALGLMAEIDRPGLTVVPPERIRQHAVVTHGNLP